MVHGQGDGIIPARAGFTHRGCRRRQGGRDHPRSRGVYRNPLAEPVLRGGSSPLARGLLCSASHFGLARGIIPARAGFTVRVHGRGLSGGDHPRSRGVYKTHDAQHRKRLGSSPLARGLPARDRVRAPGAGIIPARAGFTQSHGRTADLRPDHPRSRGVYRLWNLTTRGRTGSSPLARGLRARAGIGPRSVGIIPARAGFTEHIEAGMHMGWGSSPLARGLLPACAGLKVGWGIIPARAGFTSEHGQPGRMSTDHPRSRGVYQEHAREAAKRVGSSPLARGLPRPGAPAGVEHRIIPARAGFTRPKLSP